MSAQYCDFPNRISKLIGSACQNSEERYNSSFTPHLVSFYLLVFTSCFQIGRRDRSGKPHSKFIREHKKCILKALFSCLVSQLVFTTCLFFSGRPASECELHAQTRGNDSVKDITFYEARKPCALHSLMKCERLSLTLTIQANALQITCL